MVLSVKRLLRAAARCLACATLVWCGVGTATAQIFKLPHPDTTAGNFFGNATALDGDRALVGATGEAVCGENSGAAYVFERDPVADEWRKAARLVPDDCRKEGFFGRSVALSGDRALVAASGEFFSTRSSNAAYVFERDPTTGAWTQVARLTQEPDVLEGPFATAVALDGDRALVTTSGDPVRGQYSGAAYVFERDAATGRWERVARLTGSGGTRHGIFGGSAALGGDRAVVSASTYFAYRPGSVYVFERNASGTWHEAARFGDVDDFFISVDVDGDHVLVGESKAGSSKSGEATLYTRDASGTWRLAETLRPATPYKHGAFGTTVALQGGYALVVGFDEQLGLDFNIDRVVYVFRRDEGTGRWRQRHIIDIGEVAFGSALDFDGGVALIGNVSDRRAGEAYVVRVH